MTETIVEPRSNRIVSLTVKDKEKKVVDKSFRRQRTYAVKSSKKDELEVISSRNSGLSAYQNGLYDPYYFGWNSKKKESERFNFIKNINSFSSSSYTKK